ncbi:MAG: helix-turn-helix transcriptional regulator [Paracoccaceae bacterium]|nr:helix-turn-helix transcriptional regulator [Paracoccaceae bacterium]
MDKRNRARLFRARLAEAMRAGDVNQSALARAVGVDRSTVSQLLAPGTRLPNAQVVAECAAALGVSGDWLLGLSDLPEQVSELLAGQVLVTKATRAPSDEQIFAWHREAAGYKIRHVPAQLADMLKTPELLRWEYAPYLARTTEQAVGASEDRLDWIRQTRSDYEVAMPLFELHSLAFGTGYYNGLPKGIRARQFAHMLALYDQLFPALRVSVFDARRLHSAPITVFGPLIAVVYLGQHFLAFRDTDRVGLLTRHFDTLVREAYISDRAFPEHLEKLAGQAGLDLSHGGGASAG